MSHKAIDGCLLQVLPQRNVSRSIADQFYFLDHGRAFPERRTLSLAHFGAEYVSKFFDESISQLLNLFCCQCASVGS